MSATLVVGKKGQYVWTEGNDEEMLSKGVFDVYRERNLRYSQVAPQNMYDEKNTAGRLYKFNAVDHSLK